MKRPACPPLMLALTVLISSAAFTANAQQAPVTGQMLGGPLPPAAPVTLRTPSPADVYPLEAQAAAAAPSVAPAPAAIAPAPQPSRTSVPPASVPAPVAAHVHHADSVAHTGPTHALAYAPTPVRAKPGDTTRQLLQLQASGTQAGRALPILGDQATASYQRYLKSFEHELPVFFENNVGKSIQGGGGN